MNIFKRERIKSFSGAFRFNLFGKKINEKLVIIESDDWGAIRTPSKEALEAFKKKGLRIDKNIYNVDSLASRTDLESLFEVLSSVKGSDGKSAKFTANAVMANPDFEKIRESGFQNYFYEKLPDTFSKYPDHKNNLQIWKQGINNGIFMPQFHGREHLNYKRWLKFLRSGDQIANYCFDWKTTYSGKNDYSFMEAFDWDSPEDVMEHMATIQDGLNLFREYFGYDSVSFIAPCYSWDSTLEKILFENNIKIIQGIQKQQAPTGSFSHYKPIKHEFGELNNEGVVYNIRNCFFEPCVNHKNNRIDNCMGQISNAFLLNKPAVICSHRMNYVGFINQDNRDRGLTSLKELLNYIVKEWPDVKFISTDELIDYLP